MNRPGFVYMMASKRNGTIYIGSTSDLVQCGWQHREGLADGFTRRHLCTLLVWFEAHDSIDGARLRELQMKKWKRLWKLSEIERGNPEWDDLYETLLQGVPLRRQGSSPAPWAPPCGASGPLPSQGIKGRDGKRGCA